MVSKLQVLTLCTLIVAVVVADDTQVQGAIKPPAGVRLLSDLQRRQYGSCASYGVDCGAYCCYTGETCAVDEHCCPENYFDCKDGIKCCPYGTTCISGSIYCSYGGGGGGGGGGGSNPTTTSTTTTTTTTTASFPNFSSLDPFSSLLSVLSSQSFSALPTMSISPSSGGNNGGGSNGGGDFHWGGGSSCNGTNMTACSASGANELPVGMANIMMPVVLTLIAYIFAPFV